MSRKLLSTDELWNIVAESSFEVTATALKFLGGKTINFYEALRESQAATCALQELNNRALGLKPETLRE